MSFEFWFVVVSLCLLLFCYFMINCTINIGSKGCGEMLSNFFPHAFVIDGVSCASMEGFLQALKFDRVHVQEEVCTLVGKKAKFKGKKKKWFKTQTLWWLGKEIPRSSQEYQKLLDRAYLALSKNNEFREALINSGYSFLVHTIGKTDLTKTVLTEEEFCSRLTRLRKMIRNGLI